MPHRIMATALTGIHGFGDRARSPSDSGRVRSRRSRHIEEISTTDLLGSYPVVRYYPPSGDLYFDVLTRLGGEISLD